MLPGESLRFPPDPPRIISAGREGADGARYAAPASSAWMRATTMSMATSLKPPSGMMTSA